LPDGFTQIVKREYGASKIAIYKFTEGVDEKSSSDEV
jgi:hypothetical protein